MFRPGTITRVEDVPASRLRVQLDRLPMAARIRAAAWLKSIHFTEFDLKTMHVDAEGGIFYADAFTQINAPSESAAEPVSGLAAVPVSPLPESLAFHSRPGAPNVIYLNFCGGPITNTAWNNSEGRARFQTVAFSSDGDFNTFSDAEQSAIRRIWQRVAEDYAPFDVDVTTESPANINSRTAVALITRSTDATGAANPSSFAGGIAYINVFGDPAFAHYRPAWIYCDNLGNSESHIAEAVSHEIGHNLGLTHDGLTSGADYYDGHGSGETSWAPIMGTGYGRNVSQWSRGEYHLANNQQDDLALIAAKMPYLSDDHSDQISSSTALVVTGGTNVSSTTPETDPTNVERANKGILERNTDVDVFSFSTGSGNISLTVRPWITSSGTRGGNLDIAVELRDANDTMILTDNSATQTATQIQGNVPRGTYYLLIRNSGNGTPLSSPPTGYTSYGSIGQYFITGYIAPALGAAPSVQLTAFPNEPAWGTVTPTGGTLKAGASVQLEAIPAPYCDFVGWTNGASGIENPITLVVQTNTTIEAVFRETQTTNFPTPLWWLAANGYTNEFESAVNQPGANGLPLWQSYVAGLNPSDPTDQLRVSMERINAADVLSWNTVTGRTYTVLSSSEAEGTFAPVPGGANLPPTIHSFTNISAVVGSRFYRLEVTKQ